MDMSSALKKRVLELCKAKEISIGELARVCGISSSGLRKILNGKSRGPKMMTIKKMCDALEITLGEFFSTPEFDALEQEIQ